MSGWLVDDKEWVSKSTVSKNEWMDDSESIHSEFVNHSVNE